MDILGQRGEISEEDKAELKGMSQEELISFIVELNRQWHQLLEGLEEAHSQDLKRVAEEFLEKLRAELLSSNKAGESELKDLEKKLNDGLEASRKTQALLTVIEKSRPGR